MVVQIVFETHQTTEVRVVCLRSVSSAVSGTRLDSRALSGRLSVPR